MMTRISKTLEGIFARTAFDAARTDSPRPPGELLFLELLRSEGSLAARILASRLRAWELRQIRRDVEREISDSGHCEPLPPSAAEAFFRRFVGELVAAHPGTRTLTTAHALLHLAAGPATVAARRLEMYGIDAGLIAAEICRQAEEAGTEHCGTRPAEADEPLDRFGTDLTRLARTGDIDPLVGREAEIDRVVQILLRRRKNNPLLVGEAGVGKSAIVEELARRIAAGDVPAPLAGKRIFALDIAALVAGTRLRGEFEERMRQLLDALRRRKDTIVFIDEIHTIAGSGTSRGGLDIADMLKPLLARGEVRTIGATTPGECRAFIESDPALERRFRRVAVEPTAPAETLRILRGIAPCYERHHRVRYNEEALRACVELTGRYVSGRCFPDKAIDALDEAGARARLSALRRAHPSGGEKRLPRREEVRVTPGAVAEAVTSMTGIPAARLAGDERERLRTMQEHLTRHVVGQREAVERIVRTIRRARTGLKDERRPIGVFLFVGPTGVGKTLLAKEVSRWLFGEWRDPIRFDMSEYGERHNAARLIGAPPGYAGYGEGGQLTEAVRRNPYAVVLFDEIEKAHPELLNLLLQLFDEGRLTDGTGRCVDFRNTILIMTSNVGSREAARTAAAVGYASAPRRPAGAPQSEYRRSLERTFPPEFLGRVDDIVVFRPLEPADVERIVELELRACRVRAERMGYRLRITGRARRRLAELGYEARYGARALRRTLTDEVEVPLSELIVEGRLREGDTVVVESDRGRGIRLRVARAA